jgi:hypothetical protein
MAPRYLRAIFVRRKTNFRDAVSEDFPCHDTGELGNIETLHERFALA